MWPTRDVDSWQSLSLLSLSQTTVPLKPALAALSIAFCFASLQASPGFGGLRDPAPIVLVASTFIVGASASRVVGDTLVMRTNTVVQVIFISISLFEASKICAAATGRLGQQPHMARRRGKIRRTSSRWRHPIG